MTLANKVKKFFGICPRPSQLKAIARKVKNTRRYASKHHQRFIDWDWAGCVSEETL